MDKRIDWSPEAIEDLYAIAEYISRDSEFYARAVVSKILSVSRNISEFPMVGRVVPELEDETIRERFVYSYRLVYRLMQDGILIVAVIHGKRLLEAIDEDYLKHINCKHHYSFKLCYSLCTNYMCIFIPGNFNTCDASTHFTC